MILNLKDDDYSAEDAYNEVSQIIKSDRRVEFNHLLKNKFSKSRIVTLFLCILDMFKNGEIDIIVEENNFFIKSILNNFRRIAADNRIRFYILLKI